MSGATGPDDAHGLVLQKCANQLSDAVADLFNISLLHEGVSTHFKTAEIVPAWKEPAASNLNNYLIVAITPF